MTMSATAYCQYGATADGSLTRRGIVAADTRVLPFGTLIRVIGAEQPYSGMYRVSDSGSAIKGRSLDIYMPSCREAIQFGRQRVQVSVVRVGQAAN
jgi:3D (Asp-Asp-Asp) domain-containing protein